MKLFKKIGLLLFLIIHLKISVSACSYIFLDTPICLKEKDIFFATVALNLEDNCSILNFKLRIIYNRSEITYKGLVEDESEKIKRKELKSISKGGEISVTYFSNNLGCFLTSNESLNLFKIKFISKKEVANLEIKLNVDKMTTCILNDISNNLKINPPSICVENTCTEFKDNSQLGGSISSLSMCKCEFFEKIKKSNNKKRKSSFKTSKNECFKNKTNLKNFSIKKEEKEKNFINRKKKKNKKTKVSKENMKIKLKGKTRKIPNNKCKNSYKVLKCRNKLENHRKTKKTRKSNNKKNTKRHKNHRAKSNLKRKKEPSNKKCVVPFKKSKMILNLSDFAVDNKNSYNKINFFNFNRTKKLNVEKSNFKPLLIFLISALVVICLFFINFKFRI
ncbi:MAG: hypothetical protein LBT82_00500 [Oscillospiraceae bacterium]|jgi:hypothetical protein|nr:hypothetical protein [Oscillospiraceae bacterium]